MSESIKSTCHFILIAALAAAALAWSSRFPDHLVWSLRVGCPVVGLLVLGTVIRAHLRRDIVPDYLTKSVKKFFTRDGLCFSVGTVADKGVCYLTVTFQNQQDQPSICRIGIRPLAGILGRPKIPTTAFDIECAPAAYGVAQVPLPIARKYQGKPRLFEVGASVQYPCGKGRRVRFREGVGIMKSAEFSDMPGMLLALTSGLVIECIRSARSRLTINLPAGVAEETQDEATPEVTTLWQLGDAPLSSDD